MTVYGKYTTNDSEIVSDYIASTTNDSVIVGDCMASTTNDSVIVHATSQLASGNSSQNIDATLVTTIAYLVDMSRSYLSEGTTALAGTPTSS